MQYEFIESGLFTKMVYDYLSEADYTAFQQFLMGVRASIPGAVLKQIKEVLEHAD